MSFSEMKDTIAYGDTVLLHIGFENMLPIVATEGVIYQTKFGAVKHDQLIGKKYGTRLQCQRGWIYLVHPTPELWTQNLPHRTQILYFADISLIIFQLDLKPGSVVVESGTGSGSLSHSILRTIQPSGHLHTFEFHKERALKAEEEFQVHGLSPFVTVIHRDVCEEGFQLQHIADAVFLDLPRPWDCIESAKISLKKEGGRICSFSPCIEQVQKSCEKLKEEGFVDVVTMECVNRKYNIHYAKLQNVNFTTKDEDLIFTQCIDEPNEDNLIPAKTPKLADNQTCRDKFAVKERSREEKRAGKGDPKSLCFPSAIPALQMSGHTGFLTFATLPCQWNGE